MHVKSDNLESFWFKRKELVVQKKSKWGREKWVQEEGGDQENKKIKQKRKWKKDERKTRWKKTTKKIKNT